jgi:predicted phosphodiesterase
MRVLRSHGQVEFIMGNADRDVFERVIGPWKRTNDWCAERLSDEDLAFLRSRPATFAADGILFCHGSPQRDTDEITVATPRERIAAWCAGVKQTTVVCGHTHSQFDRQVERWHIVNPGSVGHPFGNPGAYWAMLDPDVEFRFTPYDVQNTAERILATGYPNGERMAAQIVSRSTAEDAARFFARHDRGETVEPGCAE